MPNRLDVGGQTSRNAIHFEDVKTLIRFAWNVLEDSDDSSFTYTDMAKATLVISEANLTTLVNKLLNDSGIVSLPQQ